MKSTKSTKVFILLSCVIFPLIFDAQALLIQLFGAINDCKPHFFNISNPLQANKYRKSIFP